MFRFLYTILDSFIIFSLFFFFPFSSRLKDCDVNPLHHNFKKENVKVVVDGLVTDMNLEIKKSKWVLVLFYFNFFLLSSMWLLYLRCSSWILIISQPLWDGFQCSTGFVFEIL